MDGITSFTLKQVSFHSADAKRLSNFVYLARHTLGPKSDHNHIYWSIFPHPVYSQIISSQPAEKHNMEWLSEKALVCVILTGEIAQLVTRWGWNTGVSQSFTTSCSHPSYVNIRQNCEGGILLVVFILCTSQIPRKGDGICWGKYPLSTVETFQDPLDAWNHI